MIWAGSQRIQYDDLHQHHYKHVEVAESWQITECTEGH